MGVKGYAIHLSLSLRHISFLFLHGVKVPAPLLGGLPFLAGGSLAVALCRVAVTAKDSGLIRRKIGFFRLAALAAVQ